MSDRLGDTEAHMYIYFLPKGFCRDLGLNPNTLNERPVKYHWTTAALYIQDVFLSTNT